MYKIIEPMNQSLGTKVFERVVFRIEGYHKKYKRYQTNTEEYPKLLKSVQKYWGYPKVQKGIQKYWMVSKGTKRYPKVLNGI